LLKDISKLTALPNREHENKNMTTQTMGTLNNILQSTLPQKEMPAEIKKSRALDIADGLLMIIFAFAMYAQIYSVLLYAMD
jgi:hypothetical protein